jgi:hypothetical protein
MNASAMPVTPDVPRVRNRPPGLKKQSVSPADPGGATAKDHHN